MANVEPKGFKGIERLTTSAQELHPLTARKQNYHESYNELDFLYYVKHGQDEDSKEVSKLPSEMQIKHIQDSDLSSEDVVLPEHVQKVMQG